MSCWQEKKKLENYIMYLMYIMYLSLSNLTVYIYFIGCEMKMVILLSILR